MEQGWLHCLPQQPLRPYCGPLLVQLLPVGQDPDICHCVRLLPQRLRCPLAWHILQEVSRWYLPVLDILSLLLEGQILEQWFKLCLVPQQPMDTLAPWLEPLLLVPLWALWRRYSQDLLQLRLEQVSLSHPQRWMCFLPFGMDRSLGLLGSGQVGSSPLACLLRAPPSLGCTPPSSLVLAPSSLALLEASSSLGSYPPPSSLVG